MKKLLDLVRSEDKKKPLTDQEIAEKLNVSRSEVVRIRHSLNIGDSRERMESVLEADIKRILNEAPDISERNTVAKLKEIGYSLSRTVVSRVLKESRPALEADACGKDVDKARPIGAY